MEGERRVGVSVGRGDTERSGVSPRAESGPHRGVGVAGPESEGGAGARSVRGLRDGGSEDGTAASSVLVPPDRGREELVEFLEAEEEGKQIHGVLQTVYHAAKQVAGRGTEEHVRQLTEALVGGLSNRRGSSSRGQRFVEGILEIRERLFGFVTDARVEGTNNRAERALRPLVVARKISGGSRSWRGAQVTAVLASVVQTLRLRGQSLMRDGPSYLGVASP